MNRNLSLRSVSLRGGALFAVVLALGVYFLAWFLVKKQVFDDLLPQGVPLGFRVVKYDSGERGFSWIAMELQQGFSWTNLRLEDWKEVDVGDYYSLEMVENFNSILLELKIDSRRPDRIFRRKIGVSDIGTILLFGDFVILIVFRV